MCTFQLELFWHDARIHCQESELRYLALKNSNESGDDVFADFAAGWTASVSLFGSQPSPRRFIPEHGAKWVLPSKGEIVIFKLRSDS